MPHVLAVDDDESVRNLISEYLTENGYRVTAVGSGRDMEAVMKTDAPDLVLLDVKLPGDDGFALARHIRQSSKVPIIMLTGQGHEVDRVLGLELGADDYQVKPFSPVELEATAERQRRQAEQDAGADEADAAEQERRQRMYANAGDQVSGSPDEIDGGEADDELRAMRFHGAG